MLSISADTLAANDVTPLPCADDSERPIGRIAAHTGTPSASSPVSSASRVRPIRGATGANRRQVAATVAARSVPVRARTGAASGSPKHEAITVAHSRASAAGCRSRGRSIGAIATPSAGARRRMGRYEAPSGDRAS